jgi:tRNA A-37 threonylcarbamoyl transferase component Bud32
MKFIWDISKGLYGLHSLFILHGDPTIDNIGIRNGVFILFDFDSSKIDVEFVSFKKDNWEFLKSLKFNLGEETWNNILEDYPFISDSDSIIDDMIVYMCKETKKDIDILIQDLNNLSIIY